MSIESVIDNRNMVKGFLVPLFYEEHSMKSALGPVDFAKVRDGYACARCLAEYVTYLVKCPVCAHERDLAADLNDPDPLHSDHLRDRQRTEGQDIGVPRNFDEFMAGLRESKDVDHVKLSQLKPSKWGKK